MARTHGITRHVLLLACALTTHLEAQQIKIRLAVSIDDSTAQHVFQGAFVAAFRSLGDVGVVTIAEQPDYVLSGVVICDPFSCESPASYAASLRLYSPLSKSYIRLLVSSLLPKTTQARQVDSLTENVAWWWLRHHQENHQEWVVRWGRQRYEQAIREMVRRIDTECFERTRAYSRLAFKRDSARAEALRAQIQAKDWLC